MAAGELSDRLMVAAVHTWTGRPLRVLGPVICKPLRSPAATSSSVPEADGNKVRSPTMFRSPPNAVPVRVGAVRENTPSKVPKPSSVKRIQG